ncbi:MAG TPA: hypothetical protein VE732_07950, partial [Nitrososphaera sp.]|nr:hypothetical protein [Nitrososphaera sp.]
ADRSGRPSLIYLGIVCWSLYIVRCPGGSLSRLLIESDIKYSLPVFDSKLLDTTGTKLKRFARQLSHRKHIAVIIFKESDEFDALAKTIIQSLAPHNLAD